MPKNTTWKIHSHWTTESEILPINRGSGRRQQTQHWRVLYLKKKSLPRISKTSRWPPAAVQGAHSSTSGTVESWGETVWTMSPVLRDSLTPCSCVTHETPSSPTNMRPTPSGCVTQETPSSPTKLIWCWKHLQSRRGTVKVTVLSLSSPAPPTSFCWALPFSAWREFTLESTCPQGSKPKSLSQSMFHWTPSVKSKDNDMVAPSENKTSLPKNCLVPCQIP